MLNPNNFIANSDYPFDMVAKVVTGSVVRQKSGGQSVTIDDYVKVPHGLGYRPLVAGFWSSTPDFKEKYSIGEQSSSDVLVLDDCGADDEYLYFLPMGFVGSQYYYKVFCLLPASLTTAVPAPPLGGFKNFTFNSDMAYAKIFDEVEVDTNKEQVIEHNLGFVPFIRYWVSILDGYDAQHSDIMCIGAASTSIAIDEQKITIPASTGSYGKILLRIYADET